VQAVEPSPDQLAPADDLSRWSQHASRPETIYRDLYDYRGRALKRDYCRLLRTKRNQRKPTRLIPRRRSRFGGDVLMIYGRPFAPTDRNVAGHWEGDLIMGQPNRSAIATLVERHSRYLLLAQVDAADRSEPLRVALTTAMVALPPQLRQTLTWGHGWEISQHTAITTANRNNPPMLRPHLDSARLEVAPRDGSLSEELAGTES
jgi:transposase, IS30 family